MCCCLLYSVPSLGVQGLEPDIELDDRVQDLKNRIIEFDLDMKRLNTDFPAEDRIFQPELAKSQPDRIAELLNSQPDEWQTSRGGEMDRQLGLLYRDYRMPQEAQRRFDMLPTDLAPEWLQLAQLYYQRGRTPASAATLEQAQQTGKEKTPAQALVLRALLAHELNQDKTAQEVLSQAADTDTWSAYQQFNLAQALLALDRRDAALGILGPLGETKADTEELKSLRDQANLLLGYLQLENKDGVAAAKSLERIRLASPAAAQALLGLGWANLLQGDPEAALAPLQRLVQNGGDDPALYEALLLYPYALSYTPAETQALEHYRQAIERYAQAHEQINLAIATVQQGGALDEITPPSLRSAALFHTYSGDIRDLHELAELLNTLARTLDQLADLAQRLGKTQPETKPKTGGLTPEEQRQLEEGLLLLQELVAEALTQLPPFMKLTTEERDALTDRLAQLNRLLVRADAGDTYKIQRLQVRILRSLLIWRTMEGHPAKAWVLHKDLQALRDSLTQSTIDWAAQEYLEQRKMEDYQALLERINALKARIPALLSEIEAVQTALDGHLRDWTVQALQRQQAQLDGFTTEVRIRLAGLLERLSEKAGNLE